MGISQQILPRVVRENKDGEGEGAEVCSPLYRKKVDHGRERLDVGAGVALPRSPECAAVQREIGGRTRGASKS